MPRHKKKTPKDEKKFGFRSSEDHGRRNSKQVTVEPVGEEDGEGEDNAGEGTSTRKLSESSARKFSVGSGRKHFTAGPSASIEVTAATPSR
jgi:hypothetical protein